MDFKLTRKFIIKKNIRIIYNLYIKCSRFSPLFFVIAEHGGEIYEILQRQGSESRTVSLIHLFTFSLIVAHDRAPDLLGQGRRLSDSAHDDDVVFVNRRGAEKAREMRVYASVLKL